MGSIREVREGPYYRQNYDRTRDSVPRADDLIQWAKWLLARDPERGKKSGPAEIWTVSIMSEWDSDPYGGVFIYYRFDERCVTLESVRPRTEFLGDRPYRVPDPPYDF